MSIVVERSDKKPSYVLKSISYSWDAIGVGLKMPRLSNKAKASPVPSDPIVQAMSQFVSVSLLQCFFFLT